MMALIALLTVGGLIPLQAQTGMEYSGSSALGLELRTRCDR